MDTVGPRIHPDSCRCPEPHFVFATSEGVIALHDEAIGSIEEISDPSLSN